MNLTNEEKAKLFDALQADGVDNWEGYKNDNYQETMAGIEAERQYAKNLVILQPLIEIIENNIEVDYPSIREAGARTALTEDGRLELVTFISKHYTLTN